MGYMEEDMVFVIKNSRWENGSYYLKRLKKMDQHWRYLNVEF
jgi:hypothetical protein